MQGATPIGSPLLSQKPFFRTLLEGLRRTDIGKMFELRREVAIISKIYDGIDDALARFIDGQPMLFCRGRAA